MGREERKRRLFHLVLMGVGVAGVAYGFTETRWVSAAIGAIFTMCCVAVLPEAQTKQQDEKAWMVVKVERYWFLRMAMLAVMQFGLLAVAYFVTGTWWQVLAYAVLCVGWSFIVSRRFDNYQDGIVKAMLKQLDVTRDDSPETEGGTYSVLVSHRVRRVYSMEAESQDAAVAEAKEHFLKHLARLPRAFELSSDPTFTASLNNAELEALRAEVEEAEAGGKRAVATLTVSYEDKEDDKLVKDEPETLH